MSLSILVKPLHLLICKVAELSWIVFKVQVHLNVLRLWISGKLFDSGPSSGRFDHPQGTIESCITSGAASMWQTRGNCSDSSEKVCSTLAALKWWDPQGIIAGEQRTSITEVRVRGPQRHHHYKKQLNLGQNLMYVSNQWIKTFRVRNGLGNQSYTASHVQGEPCVRNTGHCPVSTTCVSNVRHVVSFTQISIQIDGCFTTQNVR